MGSWSLLLLVTLTWLLWAVGALLGHHLAKRDGRVAPDSGLSLAPIIPIFPLVFFGVGKLVDWIIAPWGTWLIGGLHAILAVTFIVAIAWCAFRHTKVSNT
jgi:hypothetical protein